MEKRLRVIIKDPVSIREKVCSVIRNEILDGRILIGERMVEAQLAKQIGTSRTPVREALHMLEREGLLESIPRVGYRVRQISWHEIEEICEIRVVNETLAARWAMKRITPKVVQALEKNLQVSEMEVRQGDPRSFVERDGEFHEILARASGSNRLLELCQMLRRHMLRYRIESLYLEETALQAIVGHRRILDCVRRMDEDRVEAAIREHLEFAKWSIKRNAFEQTEKEDLIEHQR